MERTIRQVIIVKLIGGLGNQLFQYAAARRIALAHNADLKLDITGFSQYPDRSYNLSPFNIMENFASDVELAGIAPTHSRLFLPITSFFRTARRLRVVREKHFHFDPEILQAPDGIYLDGYWQSEKYFQDIGHIIRREYVVKPPMDKKNAEIANAIKSSESVNIHIRRGDYVADPKTHEYHGTCPLEYYHAALAELAKEKAELSLFVFSDDPEWVEDNFKTTYPTRLIDHNGPDKGYEDLRLMSLCKYHIIANSTFSWWGAWLSEGKGKVVYAPKRWFAAGDLVTSDLIPAAWHRI